MSTIVGTGTIKTTNGRMAVEVTSVVRDLWSVLAPVNGVGRINHTVYETISFPGGSSVQQVRHYETTLYDNRAQTVQSTSKGQQIDIKI